MLFVRTTSVRIPLAFLLSVLLSTSCLFPFNKDAKLRLAVFPLAVQGLSPQEATSIRTSLANALVHSDRFSVMSDATMNAVVKELGLSNLEGCTLPACLSLLGSQLNVQRVVHGTVEKQDSEIRIHVRLIDVANAKVLYEKTIAHPGSTELLISNQIPMLSDEIAATTIEEGGNTRWYLIGGAVLAVGTAIYLISKNLGSDKRENRFVESPPNPPPPPGN